jgi:RNA polymerase sigma-70 factor (ECF subfamily)
MCIDLQLEERKIGRLKEWDWAMQALPRSALIPIHRTADSESVARPESEAQGDKTMSIDSLMTVQHSWPATRFLDRHRYRSPATGATFNAMRSDIEQAVQLLRQGDEAALEQALALLQNTVFSFSMRVCGQREDAEDTMQEVLVKSVPYLPKFDSPKALVVWLYKVAKNRCLMSRRRSKFAPKQELSLEELMPDRKELETLSAEGSINPEMFAIRSEEAERLREVIQRLPAQYRVVLVLRDMEGLTDEEVAEITGLRSGTIRVRLHRARLFVRKELMKTGKPRLARKIGSVASRAAATEKSRPPRCKAMFAELSNYLDEQLDDSLCDELEKHMEGCGPCKAFLASLEATINDCRRLPSQAPDRATTSRLRKELLQQYESALSKTNT